MRTLISAAALVAALALTAPALAQEKMRDWTPASLKGLLAEMGYKISQDKPMGSDYMIVASAPGDGLPVVIYGTHCAARNGSTACPGADLTTSFKVKDEASKEAAVASLSMPDVRPVASKSAMAVRIEVSMDLSSGLTTDEIKMKFANYQKTADAAFNTLKTANLLAN